MAMLLDAGAPFPSFLTRVKAFDVRKRACLSSRALPGSVADESADQMSLFMGSVRDTTPNKRRGYPKS